MSPTPYPAPILSSVSQSGSAVGGGFIITVIGSGFLPGALIWLDGQPLVTTYAGPGVLTAIAPPHSSGSGSIQASNSGPVFASNSGSVTYSAPPSNLVLAPMPIKPGDPVCLYSDVPLVDSDWTVFGLDQQIVARIRDGAACPCFRATGTLAPGTYLVRIRTRDKDGQSRTVVRNLVIERRN